MREQQEELMQEYLTEIHDSKEKEKALLNIIQKEKRTKINLFSNILTTIMLILVISIAIHGRYIANEIKVIEICEGKPTDPQIHLVLNEEGGIKDIYNGTKSMTGKTQLTNETK